MDNSYSPLSAAGHGRSAAQSGHPLLCRTHSASAWRTGVIEVLNIVKRSVLSADGALSKDAFAVAASLPRYWQRRIRSFPSLQGMVPMLSVACGAHANHGRLLEQNPNGHRCAVVERFADFADGPSCRRSGKARREATACLQSGGLVGGSPPLPRLASSSFRDAGHQSHTARERKAVRRHPL